MRRKRFNMKNVIIATGTTMAIFAIILKIRNTLKGIKELHENNPQVKEIDQEMKRLYSELSKLKSEANRVIIKYQKLQNEADDNAEFFGTKFDTSQSNSVTHDSEGKVVSTYTHNSSTRNTSYDPERSARYRRYSEEYREVVHEYMGIRQRLRETEYQLDKISNELFKIARKYAKSKGTNLNQDGLDNLEKKLANLKDEFESEFAKGVPVEENTNFMESCVDNPFISGDDILTMLECEDLYIEMSELEYQIYESCENFKISKETRDELLNVLESTSYNRQIDDVRRKINDLFKKIEQEKNPAIIADLEKEVDKLTNKQNKLLDMLSDNSDYGRSTSLKEGRIISKLKNSSSDSDMKEYIDDAREVKNNQLKNMSISKKR